MMADRNRDHRRLHQRFDVTVPIVIVVPTEGAPTVIEGSTIDLSLGGCRVRPDAPVPHPEPTTEAAIALFDNGTARPILGRFLRSDPSSPDELRLNFIERPHRIDDEFCVFIRDLGRT